MPAELKYVVIVAAVLVVVGIATYAVVQLFGNRAGPEGAVSAGKILQRVAGEDTCHRAPEYPYAIDEAHWIMQERIDCTIERCAAKRMAHSTLVEAGRIVPASERHVR
ncbi:hypothetical protein [Nocardia sp. NPDC049707]|uniref:hypothetical protein n=1 Tax=Nocardia sp. NPDC049707 TaxID=3154735 RepID=UPI0034422412